MAHDPHLERDMTPQVGGVPSFHTGSRSSGRGLRRAVTSRSLSQAFGLATVRVYHRRAAELNRWAATKIGGFNASQCEGD